MIDGQAATFIWAGPRPPHWISDLNDWSTEGPSRWDQVEPGVWIHTIHLPRDAYLEYGYSLDGERLADPWNSRTKPSGMGHRNHYFYMPEAGPTPLARRRAAVAQGQVTRHVVATNGLALGRERVVYLYRPPTAAPCPLLVVLDGGDYRRRVHLPAIVDNLIAQGRMQPIALAMVHNGGPGRMVEYACCETHVMFLANQVLPLARQELSLVDVEAVPGAYGLCGASMGGLMALYTALRLPHIFGHVLSQSGAFGWLAHDLVVFDLIRDGPARPLRIWMDVGHFEWLLSANQRLYSLLAAKDYDIAYREYNAGHNYPAWRDDLCRGLQWLYSPT